MNYYIELKKKFKEMLQKKTIITRTTTKEGYSKEEVKRLCKLAFNAGMNRESLLRIGFTEEAITIEQWMNLNL